MISRLRPLRTRHSHTVSVTAGAISKSPLHQNSYFILSGTTTVLVQLGSHDATKFGTKLTGAAEPSDAALGADDVAQPDEEVNSCWPNGVRREPRPALRQRLRGCS